MRGATIRKSSYILTSENLAVQRLFFIFCLDTYRAVVKDGPECFRTCGLAFYCRSSVRVKL
jgi:hypothetical protein